MNIRRYFDAAEMLARVQGFLEEEEATNNLTLGLLLRMAQQTERPAKGSPPFFALAEHNGQVQWVMLMTPPHNLIVYGRGAHVDAAVDESISFLVRETVSLPGVTGPREIAARFASTWCQKTGDAATVQIELTIYQLDQVNPIAFSPGRLLPATAADRDLVADWLLAFSEITPETMDRSEAQERAEKGIAASRVYLWHDGAPVSMAWRARPTRHGIVVNGVYTPPAYRRRGYATSCVASLSNLLLDERFTFCSLFADLANPTSNSIYQKIGYRPIRAVTAYGFEQASAEEE
jgi:uncharacterized protein